MLISFTYAPGFHPLNTHCISMHRESAIYKDPSVDYPEEVPCCSDKNKTVSMPVILMHPKPSRT